MTKNDIIEAAFRVWGRDFYRNTSLSSLAKELGVSKPALYRHFESKEALTTAMTERFYDDFTESVRPGIEKAAKTKNSDDGLSAILQSICGFYARNCYDLIFSLMNIYDRKEDHKAVTEHLKARGTDMSLIRPVLEKKYNLHPKLMQLVFATLTFYMANFHKTCDAEKTNPTEEKIEEVTSNIFKVIKHGLDISNKTATSLDFEKLEKLAESKMTNEEPKYNRPIDTLFKAVAEAVAETGPWETSMEMVAKKMGLSKSSLYGHFKNKKDMLKRLFFTEFKRIIDFARLGISLSENTAEQLYLGIYSIAVYLRSRPEILITIDWIRTRKLDFGKPEKNTDIFRLFEDLKIESIQSLNEEERQLTSYWILFLLINILMKIENKDKTDIRVLYKFITLGLGGFKK